MNHLSSQSIYDEIRKSEKFSYHQYDLLAERINSWLSSEEGKDGLIESPSGDIHWIEHFAKTFDGKSWSSINVLPKINKEFTEGYGDFVIGYANRSDVNCSSFLNSAISNFAPLHKRPELSAGYIDYIEKMRLNPPEFPASSLCGLLIENFEINVSLLIDGGFDFSKHIESVDCDFYEDANDHASLSMSWVALIYELTGIGGKSIPFMEAVLRNTIDAATEVHARRGAKEWNLEEVMCYYLERPKNDMETFIDHRPKLRAALNVKAGEYSPTTKRIHAL